MGNLFQVKEVQKIKRGLYALILADEGLDVFKVEVCADLFVSEGFFKGMQIEAQRLEEIKERHSQMMVYQQALRLLGGSDHFIQQLRIKLKQRKYEDARIEPTIDRLIEEGLLDDQRTAVQWVKTHQHHSSLFVMREKLKAYAVSPQWIEQALNMVDVEEDAVLLEKAQKKWRQMVTPGKPITAQTGQKLIAFLMRQGYDYRSSKGALALVDNRRSDERDEGSEYDLDI